MCGSGSVFGIRIRIQKTPEYGSNTDLDPQHWLPSLHVEALWTVEPSCSPRGWPQLRQFASSFALGPHYVFSKGSSNCLIKSFCRFRGPALQPFNDFSLYFSAPVLTLFPAFYVTLTNYMDKNYNILSSS